MGQAQRRMIDVKTRVTRAADHHGFHHDGCHRHVAASRREKRGVLESVDDRGAGNDLPENRVLVVQIRRGSEGDEKLRSSRVGATRFRHRKHIIRGVAEGGFVFVEDRVSRAVRSLPVRRAALNHEIMDEAVESQAVVVGLVGAHRAGGDIDPRSLPRC